MNENLEPGDPEGRDESRPAGLEDEEGDGSLATFWQWFALAVLLFAWIAEATMCADRGF